MKKISRLGSIDFMAVLAAMRDPAKTMIPPLIRNAHLPFCPLGGESVYLYIIISVFVLTDTLITSGGQICSVCRHEEKCKFKIFLN